MTTKTAQLILGATLLALLASVHPGASAASPPVISVNFQGRINSDPKDPATSPLNSTEVAGVVPTSNWNNVDDAYDDDNSMAMFNGPEDGTTGPLKDDSGSLTAVTLTFQANDSWFNDVPALSISSGNARMMNGIIKSQGAGNASVFTFNNLDDAQYDIYVYLTMNGDWVRTDIADGDFSKTFYVVEQHQFTDASSFVECTNTNPSGPYDIGNYVRFTNLATYGRSNLTVSATYVSGADGNGIAGLQLVKVGSAITNPPPPVIVRQPVNRIAEQGTHVDFTVMAANAGFPLTYQWLINGTTIAGATNKTYCLDTVQMSAVASYQVIVIGLSTNRLSDPANLAVYTLLCTNSTQGAIEVPIGWFAGQTYACPPPDGGKEFQKGYCPTNGSIPVGAALFYGPNVPIASQKGPFQNPQYLPRLTIDTFSSVNVPADTGLRLRNNWGSLANAACNDDASGPIDPHQSKIGPFLLGTGATNAYRLIVMYTSSPTPPAKIHFNWLYH